MNKYELTSESKIVYGIMVYRIKALKDFGSVKKGDLGGFVEKEDNLSQKGSAWVYGDANVFGSAWVCGDARVSGDAVIEKHKDCAVVSNQKNTITLTKLHISIGCEVHTIEHWKKNIVKIGRANHYSDNEIRGTILIIKGLLKTRGY